MKVQKDSRRIFTFVQIHSLLQNLKQSSIVLQNEADLSAWLLRPFVGWSYLPSPPCLIAPCLRGSGFDFCTPCLTLPSLLWVSITFSHPLVNPTSRIPTDPSRLNSVSSGVWLSHLEVVSLYVFIALFLFLYLFHFAIFVETITLVLMFQPLFIFLFSILSWLWASVIVFLVLAWHFEGIWWTIISLN